MDYDIRPYQPGDEGAILETFNLVFGEGNPNFEPRAIDEWRWQYEANPAGMRLWVAMQEGTCAASYASQPNRVKVDDEEVIFCQIIDSMSHPDHRRGLKRPGLFIETARRMLDDFVSDPVVFGYPNKQAWRMGRTFLRYELVRWQSVLVRELGGMNLVHPPEVERVEGFGPEATRLYQRCAQEWGASVVRDESYLNWRFPSNPRFDYQMFVVRDGEELAGYAIYRPGDWPIPGVGMMVDFLVLPDRADAARLLQEAVLCAAAADGVPLVVQILPEWSVWAQRFQEWHWFAFRTDYLMSGRMTQPRYDMYFLRDHWWYTLAELDLV